MEADVGRHIDSHRSRCGLGDSDHVGNIIKGIPSRLLGNIVKEREGRQSASNRKQSAAEEAEA